MFESDSLNVALLANTEQDLHVYVLCCISSYFLLAAVLGLFKMYVFTVICLVLDKMCRIV